jgi:hypothetical protein
VTVQEEGALGFVKGLGKGVLGLLAKPVAGVIDMTTSTVDIIRQLAEVRISPSTYHLLVINTRYRVEQRCNVFACHVTFA